MDWFVLGLGGKNIWLDTGRNSFVHARSVFSSSSNTDVAHVSSMYTYMPPIGRSLRSMPYDQSYPKIILFVRN